MELYEVTTDYVEYLRKFEPTKILTNSDNKNTRKFLGVVVKKGKYNSNDIFKNNTKSIIIESNDIIQEKSFIFYILSCKFHPFVNINDLSPTMIFQTLSLYLIFYRNKDKITKNKYINKGITILSKYSYEMYLIHLVQLNKNLIHINIYHHTIFR